MTPEQFKRICDRIEDKQLKEKFFVFYERVKNALDTEMRVKDKIANIEKRLAKDNFSIGQRCVFEETLKIFQGILYGDKPTGEEVIE